MKHARTVRASSAEPPGDERGYVERLLQSRRGVCMHAPVAGGYVQDYPDSVWTGLTSKTKHDNWHLYQLTFKQNIVARISLTVMLGMFVHVRGYRGGIEMRRRVGESLRGQLKRTAREAHLCVETEFVILSSDRSGPGMEMDETRSAGHCLADPTRDPERSILQRTPAFILPLLPGLAYTIPSQARPTSVTT